MQPLGCNKSQTLFGQQMVHTFSNSINCWQWISLICTWWCISAHIWRQKCHCILLNVITHSSDTERFSRALECEGCSPKDHVSAFNDCCTKRTRRSKGIFGSTGFLLALSIKRNTNTKNHKWTAPETKECLGSEDYQHGQTNKNKDIYKTQRI